MSNPGPHRAVLWTALLLFAWLLFAELAAPRLIAWLYTAEAVEGVRFLAEERAAKPLGYFLDRWHAGARWGMAAPVGILLVHLAARSETYRRRHVGEATPGTLGAIRALVCGVLLTNVLWEDLVSTAYLPRSLLDPDGVLELLYALPLGAGAGLERLVASPSALALFHGATAILLLLGALGWRTRRVLPLAAAAYLVFGGLLRQYDRFYHTGLVPWYVLVVLCFTPAGDGWSLDRLRRLRSGRPVPPADRPAPVYGWARWAVWLTVALPYVEAGLSKLRRSGLEWLHPENLRSILLTDTLNPMEFDWRLSLGLVELPAGLVVLLAAGALGTELAYGLVLVSHWARLVLPALMAAVHLGILFLQNVLFFDLILLQAVFYDWTPLARRAGRLRRRLLERRGLGSEPAAAASIASSAAPPTAGSGLERAPRGVTLLAAVLLLTWALRIEFYPLSAMQMYSEARTSGEVEYFKVLATDAAGRRGPAQLADAVGALADARYRKVLYGSFEPGGRPVAEDLLRAVADRHGRARPPEERIVRFDVELWRWDYRRHPDDPDHGERVDAWSLVTKPAAVTEAPSQ